MVMNLLRRDGPHVAESYHRGHPHYIIGLDLGQANDYTALAVTERKLKNVGWPYNTMAWANTEGGPRRVRERRQDVENQYLVRHLGRPPLRTPYTEVVEGVIERIRALCPATLYPEGARVVLVVDATGVGRGVVDMLYNRIRDLGKGDPTVSLWPVTITGGTGRSHSPDGIWITLPKHELIFSGGVIPLQDKRLRWGPKIRDRRVLEEELSNYRKRINIATNNTQFEPWRENDHDDLLFALCLAGWAWKKYDLRYITKDAGGAEVVPEPIVRTPVTGEPLPALP